MNRLESISGRGTKEVQVGHAFVPGTMGVTTVVPTAAGGFGGQEGVDKYPPPTEVRYSIGDPPVQLVADVSALPPEIVLQVKQALPPEQAVEELKRLNERAKMGQRLFPAEAETEDQVLAAKPAAPVEQRTEVRPVLTVGIRVPGLGVIPMYWNYVGLSPEKDMLLLGRFPTQDKGFELEDSDATAVFSYRGSDFRVLLRALPFPPIAGMDLLAYVVLPEEG